MKKLLIAAVTPFICGAALVAPTLASADSGSTISVVGTSDVSDSGLFQNLIAPDFEAQYPQYTIRYFGTASGTAITDAETGAGVSGGASVLLVHAASLENQFVSNGYSYNNQPGYAVFRNDFVLAGPTSDPAHVGTNAGNNAAQAYADVATAGVAGNATFVSRGGTAGTTVEEHAIWALAYNANLLPASVPVCAVPSSNPSDGGGYTPVSSSVPGFTDGAPCSTLPGADIGSNGLPTGAGLPTWYEVTSANQGQNVIDANACTTYSTSGANSCYVFTDRGTYDYLASGTDPAGSISGLKIVTRNNGAGAPGGAYALINYFHAYIINQAKVQAATGSSSIAVNLTAAQDLVSLLTSASFQAQLASYLTFTGSTSSNLTTLSQIDSGGAPFVADAAPTLTESGLSTTVAYGTPVTVTGTLTNAEPGYPALSGQTVNVDEIEGGLPVPVGQGTTNSSGGYSITFTPTTTGAYEVATGQLTQVENSSLSPTFSDTLSPATTASATLTVAGTPASHVLGFSRVSVKVKGTGPGKLTVRGSLSPATVLAGATVKLYAYSAKTGRNKLVGHARIAAGRSTYTVTARLAKGRYVLQFEYVQPGQTTVFSGLRTVTVK